jgi:hypothetical protein
MQQQNHGLVILDLRRRSSWESHGELMLFECLSILSLFDELLYRNAFKKVISWGFKGSVEIQAYGTESWQEDERDEKSIRER